MHLLSLNERSRRRVSKGKRNGDEDDDKTINPETVAAGRNLFSLRSRDPAIAERGF